MNKLIDWHNQMLQCMYILPLAVCLFRMGNSIVRTTLLYAYIHSSKDHSIRINNYGTNLKKSSIFSVIHIHVRNKIRNIYVNILIGIIWINYLFILVQVIRLNRMCITYTPSVLHRERVMDVGILYKINYIM